MAAAGNSGIVLNIDEQFDPLYGSPVIIPPGYVIYRGYDMRYPAIADRPTHYSVKNVATAYAALQGSTLGCFKNTRALRLLDFRYMCVLLNQMFLTRKDNTQIDLDPIVRTYVGYGLCGIHDQLQIGGNMFRDSIGMKHLQKYYDTYIKGKSIMERPLDVNPVSPAGFRIAETLNDGYILNFVKTIFGDIADGFIAPRLKTPYHHEKGYMMSPEIVLFSPLSAQMQEISDSRTFQSQGISEVLELRSSRSELKCTFGMAAAHRKMKILGGGGLDGGVLIENMNASDAFFQSVEDQDADAVQLLNKSTRAATKWKKDFELVNFYASHPSSHVHDWFAA